MPKMPKDKKDSYNMNDDSKKFSNIDKNTSDDTNNINDINSGPTTDPNQFTADPNLEENNINDTNLENRNINSH